MSEISVSRASFQVEDRGWLSSPHGEEMTPGVTLDVSKFTQATHYPNGYIKSGCVLAKQADGRYGPAAAGDTPAGILFSSLQVVGLDGSTKKSVSNAMLIHGMVNVARMPYAGQAGGFNAAFVAKLPLIVFENQS